MNNQNNNKPSHGNSMFLYTALIFVMALILIILSFFGQTNLSVLRKNGDKSTLSQANQLTDTPADDIKESEVPNEEYAQMTNTISELDTENKNLKNELSTYDSLLSANGYISAGDKENAKLTLEAIDVETLTENQKILYDNIIKKINE